MGTAAFLTLAVWLSLLSLPSVAAVPPGLEEPPTTPDVFRSIAVSPHGTYAIVVERSLDLSWGHKHADRYLVVRMDCLGPDRGLEACVEISGRLELTHIGDISWGEHDDRLVAELGVGWLLISRATGAWVATRKPYSLTGEATPPPPPVLSDQLADSFPALGLLESPSEAWAALPATVRSQAGPDFAPASVENISFAATGRVVLWSERRGDVMRMYVRSGITMDAPYVVAFTYPATPRIWSWPRADGRGFIFWSNSLDANGRLLEVRDQRTRRFSLPRSGGPLRPLLGPSALQVYGVYGPDGFHGLDAPPRIARGLDAFIRGLRRQHPDLELRTISTDDGLSRVLLNFNSAEGGDRLFAYDPKTATGFQIGFVGQRRTDRAIRSTAVRIPSASGGLPARLYQAGGMSRGVVITFHGGPGSNNTENRHETTRRLIAMGFDVISVDYRGSPGYGGPHFLALRRPARGVLVEDLRASVAWARGAGGYRDRAIGFHGVSFGGWAGALGAEIGFEGLSFVVLDSGFFDFRDPPLFRSCDMGNWQPYVLGETVFAEDRCLIGRTGLMRASRYSSVPVFMYVGSKDYITKPDIAEAWSSYAGARGGCIFEYRAAGGSHTTATLDDRALRSFDQILGGWIDDVLAGKGDKYCGGRQTA